MGNKEIKSFLWIYTLKILGILTRSKECEKINKIACFYKLNWFFATLFLEIQTRAIVKLCSITWIALNCLFKTTPGFFFLDTQVNNKRNVSSKKYCHNYEHYSFMYVCWLLSKQLEFMEVHNIRTICCVEHWRFLTWAAALLVWYFYEI